MYSDVERLQGTLRDLGGLVNEPDTLPDVTRDYIAVRQSTNRHTFVTFVLLYIHMYMIMYYCYVNCMSVWMEETFAI